MPRTVTPSAPPDGGGAIQLRADTNIDSRMGLARKHFLRLENVLWPEGPVCPLWKRKRPFMQVASKVDSSRAAVISWLACSAQTNLQGRDLLFREYPGTYLHFAT
jgi:hypothetical protein